MTLLNTTFVDPRRLDPRDFHLALHVQANLTYLCFVGYRYHHAQGGTNFFELREGLFSLTLVPPTLDEKLVALLGDERQHFLDLRGRLKDKSPLTPEEANSFIMMLEAINGTHMRHLDGIAWHEIPMRLPQ